MRHLTGDVQARSQVTSEITLPEDGARGLGVLINETDERPYFITTHEGNTGYYIGIDGAVDSSFDVDYVQGAALTSDAAYVGGVTGLMKYPFANEKTNVEREMPGPVYALAAGDTEGVLWAGGEGGRVWEMDPATLDITRSISFDGTVFCLAWDGTYLWVGEDGTGRIAQYDPDADETVATYEYPNAQSVYDYAFTRGRLWLEGDGVLYETDIDSSIPNQSPSASFSVSPTPAEVGSQVAFDATESTDPDGDVVSYEWDLVGDGAVDATGAETTTTYSEAGEYDVSLTVSDGDGATDTTTRSVSVSESPTARITVSPSAPRVGQEVTFSAGESTDPDGSTETHRWDLTGDGTIDTTGTEVTNTYRSPGEVEITLTVTDDNGLTDRARTVLDVQSAGTSVPDTTDDRAAGSSSTEPATTTEDGAGFGVAAGVAGIGGSIYLLQRLDEDDSG